MAAFVLLLLIIFYFRSAVSGGFSYLAHVAFRPVLVLGGNAGSRLASLGSYFRDKSNLEGENEALRRKLGEQNAMMSDHDTLTKENSELKEALGRKSENDSLVLSAILSKPNRSPYDTLVIDAGTSEEVESGDLVFAAGNVPIGRVKEVYPFSSKVVLFSTSREKTEVVLSEENVFIEIIGRGGGNFEMVLPRESDIQKGAEVALPGIRPYVVGIVETVISDPRDAFAKALLVSPVNIYELKFVQVKIN